MLTTVAVRLALEKIIMAIGAPLPDRITVVVPRAAQPWTFVVSVPPQYRADLYAYLAENVRQLTIPLSGDPLVLSTTEAEELLTHSHSLRTVGC